jgi:hypothetical protein
MCFLPVMRYTGDVRAVSGEDHALFKLRLGESSLEEVLL